MYNPLGIDMSDLEIALHSTKLNYESMNAVLNKLIHTPRILEGKDTITLYIDIQSLLRPLYKIEMQECINSINEKDRWMLVGEIINIIAHYRFYFFSRMGKYTNIIMYYTDKESKYCTSIDSNYNNKYYNSRIRFNNDDKVANRIINNSLELVKTFIKYIPYAYVINTGTVDPRGWVRYMIDNQNKETDYSLILTNDDLYLDMLKTDRIDASILRVQGKNSLNIYLGNAYDYIFRKIKSEIELPSSNNSIPLLFAIMGSKEHDIVYKSRTGPHTAYKKLIKLVEEHGIDLSVEYEPEVLSILIPDETINKNYKLTSSLNLSKNITDTEHLLIENQFIDINDVETVNLACNKYFKQTEILLSFLYAGENYQG